MSDVGDVYNIVKDVATLFDNGQSQAMGARAFGVPAGMQPNQLDWGSSAEHTLQVTLNWTNRAKEWFGMSSGTALRIGCTWQFGGTSPQHPGAYLHDAYLWAVLDAEMLGQDITVTGQFGDAVPYGNTVELSGEIIVNVKQFHVQMDNIRYDLRIRGNGYGVLRPV